MTSSDWSDTAAKPSWSTGLYKILRPAPRPLPAKFGRSSSLHRHSPGDVWRHILASAVYHDLAGTALKHYSRQAVVWRRFVRVESLGLSGVVLYEIPIPPSLPSSGTVDCEAICEGAPKKTPSVRTARGALALRILRNPLVVVEPPTITLSSVFGDLNNVDDTGMDLDDLMDQIDVKVVYFPTYACTSFVVGQVMTAFLNDCPTRRPMPAQEGFSVCRDDHVILHSRALKSSLDKGAPSIADTTPTASSSVRKVEEVLHLPPHTVPDTLALETDDPYSALCVHSSMAYNRLAKKSFLGLFSSSSSHSLCTNYRENGSGENAADASAPVLMDEASSSHDERDSESNIATDGQSSPIPHGLSEGATLHSNPPSYASSIDTPNSEPCSSLSTSVSMSNDELVGRVARYPVTPRPLEVAAPTAPVAFPEIPISTPAKVQKHYRLSLSSQLLSSRLPCLAKAKRRPQTLYVYKDFHSSKSFMDLSGAE